MIPGEQISFRTGFCRGFFVPYGSFPGGFVPQQLLLGGFVPYGTFPGGFVPQKLLSGGFSSIAVIVEGGVKDGHIDVVIELLLFGSQ